ncbi:transcription intermediary factor 1-beta-like isoform X3 [Haliotis rufescens]|uniref:transcription intermediary factor 1-beta-like isoform X3 n=1 Tax=Haliotis rufescens TaxID=6454 RepID=UPI00201F750A|nr:transcription intermediary factor 1-beta-like isoform X3 [Haliotis rufescens]
MSDYVSASAIKDLLTECPICTEHFDEARRTPRRMPCCVQSICQACLETYSKGLPTLSCPMCRHQHNLPGGVKSLPKEPIILRILDHLKIVKGLHLPCTNCSDGNPAMSRCDDCCVFLCQECLNAHKRLQSMRDHQTVSFDDMRERPVESFRRLHKCTQHHQPLQFYCHTCDQTVCVSCTVVEHDKGSGHNVVSVENAHESKAVENEDVLQRLDEKGIALEKAAKDLQKKCDGIKSSRSTAKDEINKAFTHLMEALQQRKTIMLSEVDRRSDEALKPTEEALDSTVTLLTKVKSSTEYTRQMRGKADKIEDLQVMGSSAASLNSILAETPKDVGFVRIGISFVSACFKKITSLMQIAGIVRVVSFSPAKSPDNVPLNKICNSITLDEGTLEQAAAAEYMNLEPFGGSGMYYADLEWDSSTASALATVSGSVVTNKMPLPPPPASSCRLQSNRHVLASTPLVVGKGQRIMCAMRVTFSVIKPEQKDKIIFDVAFTHSPIEANTSQPVGLSVTIVTCSNHDEYLCIKMYYNNECLSDNTLTPNNPDTSHTLDICFILDEAKNTIHVLAISHPRVVTKVPEVMFRDPLWLVMSSGLNRNTRVSCELLPKSAIDF